MVNSITNTQAIIIDKIEKSDLKSGRSDLSVDFEFVEVNNKEKMVITINDKETGKVIKRIPSEVTISIMKHLFEKYGMGQITNAKV